MRILTWNMQGQSGLGPKEELLGYWLNTGIYDVVCIQEATRPLGRFQQVGMNNGVAIYQVPAPYHEQRAVNQINNYTALYYEWGNANMRCSLVTYVKNFANLNNCGIVHNMNYPNARQMLWTFHNGLHIGNIHLISGNEGIAIQQFNYFRAMMPVGALYCIIGDYNIDALTNPNINGVQGFVYVQMPTQQGGGCLDYMYANFAPIRWERKDKPGRFSDHSPVAYEW